MRLLAKAQRIQLGLERAAVDHRGRCRPISREEFHRSASIDAARRRD
jgi:hypothetical protein